MEKTSPAASKGESVLTGRVKAGAYRWYLGRVGGGAAAVVLLLYVLNQVGKINLNFQYL